MAQSAVDWTGANDAGSSTYKPAQRRRVIDVLLQHRGRQRSIHSEDVATRAGITGRCLRAIFSDIDGEDLVLGFDDKGGGVFVATCPEEAMDFTNRLLRQSRKMEERARRRDALVAGMPPLQGNLL